MISLRNILLEASNTSKKLNVLFVSDNTQDRRKGFARQLISNRIITGEIYTKERANSKTLSNLVEFNAASYYDLVVVLCKGVYDSDSDKLLNNLSNIIEHCHGLNIKVVLSTIAPTDFVKTDSKVNLTIANNYQINLWIERKADFILNTQEFSDDDWFEKDGINFARIGHENLYKQMLNIIAQLDTNIDPEEEKEKISDPNDVLLIEPGQRDRQISIIQRKLILLGYEIKYNELERREYGPTTINAVRTFKMKNGLDADTTIDKQTLLMLKDIKPEKEKQVVDIVYIYNVIPPSAEDIKIYKKILDGISAPDTENTLTFFYAWRQAEGATAAFNPFNTTQPWPGSTRYNDLGDGVGVRNYDSAETGITATVKTMLNGYYNTIVEMLRNDSEPMKIATEALPELKTWGTGKGIERVLKAGRIDPPEISKITTQIRENKNKNKISI
jgi:peptidoglycan hydrolase-like protein with peptidoglycan-binding domain